MTACSPSMVSTGCFAPVPEWSKAARSATVETASSSTRSGAVAGCPVGRPLTGSTELPRATRRALGRHRSRAGAPPRHAAVPPLVMLSASAPASRPVALAAALASLSSSRAFLYLPKYLRGARGFGWDDAAPGRGSGARHRGAAAGQRGGGRARASGRPTGPCRRQGRRAARGTQLLPRSPAGAARGGAAQAARGGPGRPGRPGVARGGWGGPGWLGAGRAGRAGRGGRGGAASSWGRRRSERPGAYGIRTGRSRLRMS